MEQNQNILVMLETNEYISDFSYSVWSIFDMEKFEKRNLEIIITKSSSRLQSAITNYQTKWIFMCNIAVISKKMFILQTAWN